MTRAYIALGANLGDPIGMLQSVCRELNQRPDTKLIAQSRFYRTAPIESSGPDYVNAVVEIETSMSAADLLLWLQQLENQHGRVRPQGVINAPRTLDLDVLLFGQECIATEVLTVPHPRMHQRAFVLVPLLEIAPMVHIPGKGNAADFLPEVQDQIIFPI